MSRSSSRLKHIQCFICDEFINVRDASKHQEVHLKEYCGSYKFKSIIVNESGEVIENGVELNETNEADKIQLIPEIMEKVLEKDPVQNTKRLCLNQNKLNDNSLVYGDRNLQCTSLTFNKQRDLRAHDSIYRESKPKRRVPKQLVKNLQD